MPGDWIHIPDKVKVSAESMHALCGSFLAGSYV